MKGMRIFVVTLLALLLCIISAPISHSEEVQAAPAPSENYLPIFAIAEILNRSSITEALNQIRQEEVKPPETGYVLVYYVSGDVKKYPKSQADLQKLFEYLLWKSELVKNDELQLLLFFEADASSTNELVVAALARANMMHGGFEKGAVASSQEMVNLLHKIHFAFTSNVPRSKVLDETVTAKQKIFPVTIIYKAKGLDEDNTPIYATISKPMVWDNLDVIVAQAAKTAK
ncbi:MAG: hypothetical protein NTX82_00230 [Candidatus Parcubacteria bacterium]|nr:hypothetical protein [Candidatus Parcubacteria bacterium]